MEKLWKCPYIDHACGTHGLCAKCRPVITARFYPTHKDEPAEVHFQTMPQFVPTSLSAMEEMLIEFMSKDLISDYTIFVEWTPGTAHKYILTLEEKTNANHYFCEEPHHERRKKVC